MFRNKKPKPCSAYRVPCSVGFLPFFLLTLLPFALIAQTTVSISGTTGYPLTTALNSLGSSVGALTIELTGNVTDYTMATPLTANHVKIPTTKGITSIIIKSSDATKRTLTAVIVANGIPLIIDKTINFSGALFGGAFNNTANTTVTLDVIPNTFTHLGATYAGTFIYFDGTVDGSGGYDIFAGSYSTGTNVTSNLLGNTNLIFGPNAVIPSSSFCYAGSYANGSVAATSTANITGNTYLENNGNVINIFGGSGIYGSAGTMTSKIDGNSTITQNSNFDNIIVHGGGNSFNLSLTRELSILGTTTVNINGRAKEVYGGGKSEGTNAKNSCNNVIININSTEPVNEIYGGANGFTGNTANTIVTNSTINLENCKLNTQIFAGGKYTTMTSSTINIKNLTVNSSSAQINSNVHTGGSLTTKTINFHAINSINFVETNKLLTVTGNANGTPNISITASLTDNTEVLRQTNYTTAIPTATVSSGWGVTSTEAAGVKKWFVRQVPVGAILVGTDGTYPTISAAVASLTVPASDVKLFIISDITEIPDISIPTDKGITSVTIFAANGANRNINANIKANEISLIMGTAIVWNGNIYGYDDANLSDGNIKLDDCTLNGNVFGNTVAIANTITLKGLTPTISGAITIELLSKFHFAETTTSLILDGNVSGLVRISVIDTYIDNTIILSQKKYSTAIPDGDVTISGRWSLTSSESGGEKNWVIQNDIATITVGSTGCDYLTIAAALAASTTLNGDIMQLKAGETHAITATQTWIKSVSMVGQDATAIVKPSGNFGISINTVSGFKFQDFTFDMSNVTSSVPFTVANTSSNITFENLKFINANTTGNIFGVTGAATTNAYTFKNIEITGTQFNTLINIVGFTSTAASTLNISNIKVNSMFARNAVFNLGNMPNTDITIDNVKLTDVTAVNTAGTTWYNGFMINTAKSVKVGETTGISVTNSALPSTPNFLRLFYIIPQASQPMSFKNIEVKNIYTYSNLISTAPIGDIYKISFDGLLVDNCSVTEFNLNTAVNNVVIKNSKITTIDGYANGISIVGAAASIGTDGLKIINNSFIVPNINYAAINIAPTDAKTSTGTIEIKDNILSNGTNIYSLVCSPYSAGDITIENNTCASLTCSPVLLTNNLNITKNTITTTGTTNGIIISPITNNLHTGKVTIGGELLANTITVSTGAGIAFSTNMNDVDVDILNNTFLSTATPPTGTGISINTNVQSLGDLNIKNNTFSTGIGVTFTSPNAANPNPQFANIVVDKNQFNVYSTNYLNFGYSIPDAKVSNITITDNNFDFASVTANDVVALFLGKQISGNYTITGNILDGSSPSYSATTAPMVFGSTSNPPTFVDYDNVTFINNAFLNNTKKAIQFNNYPPGYQLKATENYWGSYFPPFNTIISPVASVSFAPYYHECCPLSNLSGSGNYTVTVPTDYPTINAAIDDVKTDWTTSSQTGTKGKVIVLPGTYNEDVIIYKMIDLVGPQTAVVGKDLTRDPASSATEAIVNGNLRYSSDHVSISGFTFNCNGTIYGGFNHFLFMNNIIASISGAYSNSCFAIATTSGSGLGTFPHRTNITFDGNYFKRQSSNYIIWLRWGCSSETSHNKVDNLTISNNKIENKSTTLDAEYSILNNYYFGSHRSENLKANYNEFIDGRVQIFSGKDFEMAGNIFTGVQSYLMVSGINGNIHHNIFANTTSNGDGCYVSFGTYGTIAKDITISDNTFYYGRNTYGVDFSTTKINTSDAINSENISMSDNNFVITNTTYTLRYPITWPFTNTNLPAELGIKQRTLPAQINNWRTTTWSGTFTPTPEFLRNDVAANSWGNQIWSNVRMSGTGSANVFYDWKITFEPNGGTLETFTSPSNKNRSLHNRIYETTPPTATKMSSFFEGWYADAALTTKWNFATDKFIEDKTLYAKWITSDTVVVSIYHNTIFAGGESASGNGLAQPYFTYYELVDGVTGASINNKVMPDGYDKKPKWDFFLEDEPYSPEPDSGFFYLVPFDGQHYYNGTPVESEPQNINALVVYKCLPFIPKNKKVTAQDPTNKKWYTFIMTKDSTDIRLLPVKEFTRWGEITPQPTHLDTVAYAVMSEANAYYNYKSLDTALRGPKIPVTDLRLLSDNIYDPTNRENLIISSTEIVGEGKMYKLFYMNLVDIKNGDNQVFSNEPINVYLPYPKGTDISTVFRLIHFPDFVRGIVNPYPDNFANHEVILTNTPMGINYQVANFSPFALAWDNSLIPPGSRYKAKAPDNVIFNNAEQKLLPIVNWYDDPYYMTLKLGVDYDTLLTCNIINNPFIDTCTVAIQIIGKGVFLGQDTIVYYKILPKIYTVKYDINGGDAGTMSDQQLVFVTNNTQNLIPNSFTKTGRYFLGWNTMPNGSGATYTDQNSMYFNTVLMHLGILQLYAQWSPTLCPASVYDAPNGDWYEVLKLADRCWYKSNLRATKYQDNTTIPFAKLYSCTSCPSIANQDSLYGRLYTYEDIFNPLTSLPFNLCPPGWSLPTFAEWALLEPFAPESLRTNDWLNGFSNSNSTTFSMRPAGYWNGAANRFEKMFGYTRFWALDSGSGGSLNSSTVLQFRYNCEYTETIEIRNGDAVSARCIMD